MKSPTSGLPDSSSASDSTTRPLPHFSVLAARALRATNPVEMASDILYGAEAIAAYLFGDPAFRRRVYHLVRRKRLPMFRIGANICARKSVLEEWIRIQERKILKE